MSSSTILASRPSSIVSSSTFPSVDAMMNAKSVIRGTACPSPCEMARRSAFAATVS